MPSSVPCVETNCPLFAIGVACTTPPKNIRTAVMAAIHSFFTSLLLCEYGKFHRMIIH
ncbi:hypothetical protein K2X92_02055 [Candidatus Gracilibacteria bacterium]|nr:hypothetical protein [Candidatus Gracilibacteria bacterium]